MKASNSRIQCYKQCRRKYQLRYIEGLYPVNTSDALSKGRMYHEQIEAIFNIDDSQPCEDVKVRGMVEAFKYFILPQLSEIGVAGAERWVEYECGDNSIIGRIDAFTETGEVIEHKTTSYDIDDLYIEGLKNNEQILTYLAATNTNAMWYTVCKKPTIRQRNKESDEEFFNRIMEWYAEDTDSKIRLIRIERSNEEIEEFKQMQSATVEEMAKCKLFYKNTCSCWNYGKLCDYAPICNNYDPDAQYVDFERGDKECT